jgi:hypothetical protein
MPGKILIFVLRNIINPHLDLFRTSHKITKILFTYESEAQRIYYNKIEEGGGTKEKRNQSDI